MMGIFSLRPNRQILSTSRAAAQQQARNDYGLLPKKAGQRIREMCLLE